MTTVLADAKLGVMVCDSVATDGDRVWNQTRKVYRIGGALFGFAGDLSEAQAAIQWIRTGSEGHPPRMKEVNILMLSREGLYLFGPDMKPMQVTSGIDAIGSGAKAALCTYEALGFENPQKAVRIVCKYDQGSRPPVKVYKL